MHIVGTIHSKGGVGKSCIAINVARDLQLRGLDVAVLDTDKQSTASNWQASGNTKELPAVYSVEKPSALEKNIKDLKGAFDVVVIDGGAHLREMHAAIIKAANLILIPTQPAPADIWPLKTIVELVDARQELTGSPKAAFVISRRKARTRLSKVVEETLAPFEIPVWEGTRDRVAYAEAIGNGISVIESSDEKAAAEIRQITDNVIQTLRHE
ncbi:MAG: ParA family partition ATPase [Salinibacter sp.]